MRYYIALTISLLMFSSWAAALSADFSHPDPDAVRIVVEPNPAFVDEDIKLRLISSGRHTRLDQGRLTDDFEVLGRRGSTSSQVINGRTSSTYETTIIVRAKRAGKLTVPRLKLNGKSTKPVPLEVRQRPQAKGKSQEVFLKTEVQPTTAYVGQQVMIRQQLHASSNITSGELSTPTLSNAVVERIGDDRRFTAIIDGVRYNVIERVYAAFPEDSGNVVIDGGRFNGEVDKGSSGFGVFRNTRRVNAAAGQTKLTVNPPPTAARGHWMPASAFKASVELIPADAELRVGEPVTLKYQIIADGILGSALPEISLNQSDRFSAYIEPGTHETQGTASGVSGKRELTVALIPLHEGTLTFPAMDLPWWDVINDKQQIARIEEQVFNVLPSADATPIPTQTSDTQLGEAAPAVPVENEISKREIAAWILVGVFAALWLLTLLLLRRRPKPLVNIEPTVSARKAVSLYEVSKALKNNDVAAASTAICGWASAQLDQSVTSLPEAGRRLACSAEDSNNGERIAALLETLDSSRFGGQSLLETDALLEACQKWAQKKPKKLTAEQQLPGLYTRG